MHHFITIEREDVAKAANVAGLSRIHIDRATAGLVFTDRADSIPTPTDQIIVNLTRQGIRVLAASNELPSEEAAAPTEPAPTYTILRCRECGVQRHGYPCQGCGSGRSAEVVAVVPRDL